LEYRGYDSAGVALQVDGKLWRARAATGTHSLEDLRTEVVGSSMNPVAGIGHTRWATHGNPNEENAHPHLDCTSRVAVVHNGIIENNRELRTRLEADGHTFASDTDTEVVAHLIEDELEEGRSLADAVRIALRELEGTFAVAIVWAGQPGTIVAARRSSPLVVGLGDGETNEGLVASDIPALLSRTRKFCLVDDDQLVEIRKGSVQLSTLAGKIVEPVWETTEYDLEAAEKGGFDDFMSKEINEQPRAVADTLRGRVRDDDTIAIDQLRISDDELRSIDKVFVVACGSSFHAGMVAKYAIERWARLPVEVDIASEFRYRDPVLDERTLVVGISQSGETLDTMLAMEAARGWNAKVLVVTNVVGSSMARSADGVIYTRAGPEIGVAATKTHVAQVVALEILALYLAQLRGVLEAPDTRLLLSDLSTLPKMVQQALDRKDDVEAVAKRLIDTRDFYFLGRHVGYPVALEGALKLKEISYLRAEGYPAGEMKHGPIALIESGSVVVAIATRTPLWEKMMSNVEEVRTRGAKVVLVANDGDEETASIAAADEVLWVPRTKVPHFAPVVDVVPLQFLAYFLARQLGHNVDRPRNLAKTVTVE
jgi:glucosamine--fructose-6-phosphate aminotransferase (isomerizing)